MADWADDVVNIGVNGLSSVKVKAAGDGGYYTLPFFRDGTITVTPIGTSDNKKRTQYHHFRATITCSCMCSDVTNIIEVLPVFMTGTSGANIFVKATGLDGQTKFFSEDISATTGFMGVSWRLTGSAGAERAIEFTFSRLCTVADIDAAMVSPSTADGSQASSDALYALASLVRADIRPAIIQSVYWVATTGTITDNALTNIRDASLEMTTVGEEDSYGRFRATAADVSFSCFSMQSHQDELADYADHVTRQNDVRVNFTDDYADFNAAELGVSFEIRNEGDMTGTSGIRISGGGTILPSEFAGIWVDTTPT